MIEEGSRSKPGAGLQTLLSRPGELVLVAVDQGVMTRWEPAQRRALSLTGYNLEESIRHVRRSFRTELGVAGGAAGGVAALPGSVAPGVAAGIAEIGWSTIRLTDMVLTIAALHGYDESSVEERRAWILAILAYGDAAAATFTKLATEIAKGTGARVTKAIPNSSLRAINHAIGRTIITKYGTKRGAIAVGRLLPLGIGVAIGFGFNAALVEQVGRHADQFFSELAPVGPPKDSISARGSANGRI